MNQCYNRGVKLTGSNTGVLSISLIKGLNLTSDKAS